MCVPDISEWTIFPRNLETVNSSYGDTSDKFLLRHFHYEKEIRWGKMELCRVGVVKFFVREEKRLREKNY